jgi:hypothetical protein
MVMRMPSTRRLQGSCCGPMDFERYQGQVTGLVSYRRLAVVLPDPYDVSVRVAKRLLRYQRAIRLTRLQQATYRQAMRLSDEHGPCCCRCWRWHVFEGQARYLIARGNYRAHQIARIWDLEDGCGGEHT